MKDLEAEDSSSEFAHGPVPAAARQGFGWIFSVWANFQLSTVMLFFGGLTLAHLPLGDALLVVTVSTILISSVSFAAGYLGARTGLSTTLLCERVFGTTGGRVQQAFQAFVELGWFVVIVGLTGDAAAALLRVDSSAGRATLTLAMGTLYVCSVLFGFRGLRLISVVAAPVVLGLLAWISYGHLANVGTLWRPVAGPLNLFQSISIATGTFITGAALSADIARFARDSRTGALAGSLAFLVTIPVQLLLGAIVAMTHDSGPDFIAAVSASGIGAVVFVFVIAANCVGDATLYLAVVPLTKLTHWSRFRLVAVLGVLGSALAALGVSQHIVGWLGTLSVLLPPLAGPLIWEAIRTYGGRDLIPTDQRFRPGFFAWLAGAVAGGGAELSGVGLAPVAGMVVSFCICTIADRRAAHTR